MRTSEPLDGPSNTSAAEVWPPAGPVPPGFDVGRAEEWAKHFRPPWAKRLEAATGAQFGSPRLEPGQTTLAMPTVAMPTLVVAETQPRAAQPPAAAAPTAAPAPMAEGARAPSGPEPAAAAVASEGSHAEASAPNTRRLPPVKQGVTRYVAAGLALVAAAALILATRHKGAPTIPAPAVDRAPTAEVRAVPSPKLAEPEPVPETLENPGTSAAAVLPIVPVTAATKHTPSASASTPAQALPKKPAVAVPTPPKAPAVVVASKGRVAAAAPPATSTPVQATPQAQPPTPKAPTPTQSPNIVRDTPF